MALSKRALKAAQFGALYGRKMPALDEDGLRLGEFQDVVRRINALDPEDLPKEILSQEPGSYGHIKAIERMKDPEKMLDIPQDISKALFETFQAKFSHLLAGRASL